MKFWTVVIAAIIIATGVWYFSAPTTDTTSIPVDATVVPTVASSVDNTQGTPKGRVIRLTTADIKERLNDFGTEQAQIADIILAPDTATIELLVGGVKGVFTTGLAVANNQIVLVKPAIGGLLGAVLPAEKIGQLLQDELNNRLIDQPILDIRIVDGAIEIVVNE